MSEREGHCWPTQLRTALPSAVSLLFGADWRRWAVVASAGSKSEQILSQNPNIATCETCTGTTICTRLVETLQGIDMATLGILPGKLRFN